jgi:hypothetical protein
MIGKEKGEGDGRGDYPTGRGWEKVRTPRVTLTMD